MPVPFPFTTFGANRSSAGGGGGCDITAGDNLNHWWKLNTGNVSATDEGTTAVARHDLTFTADSSVVTTATNGDHSGTEDVNIFNGTNAFGESISGGIEDSIAICAFSVSFWVKLTAAPAGSSPYYGPWICMINGNGGGSNGWGVGFGGADAANPDEIRFWTGNGYTTQYASIARPVVDEWTNIVCTYDFNADPKVRMIYKDGVAGTNIATYNAWGGDPCGGVTQRAGDYYFTIASWGGRQADSPNALTECELGDFRIYDICLTEEQAQNIYCEGSGDTWP